MRSRRLGAYTQTFKAMRADWGRFGTGEESLHSLEVDMFISVASYGTRIDY